jgi:hypothetical protein
MELLNLLEVRMSMILKKLDNLIELAEDRKILINI